LTRFYFFSADRAAFEIVLFRESISAEEAGFRLSYADVMPEPVGRPIDKSLRERISALLDAGKAHAESASARDLESERITPTQ